jgi:MOSC domain-containing protein YiiM
MSAIVSTNHDETRLALPIGEVAAVSLDAAHRFSKVPVDVIRLVAGHGVESDAHAGLHVQHRYLAKRQPELPNARQIHLISIELFADLLSRGYTVAAGQLGENITCSGLELENLPLRTRLRVGADAAVELTGIRTPCGLIDRFQKGLRRDLFNAKTTGPRFRCGVFGVVTVGGQVSRGDSIVIELPDKPWSHLPEL